MVALQSLHHPSEGTGGTHTDGSPFVGTQEHIVGGKRQAAVPAVPAACWAPAKPDGGTAVSLGLCPPWAGCLWDRQPGDAEPRSTLPGGA